MAVELTLGKRIRNFRETLGLTQRQLAAAIGVSPATVAHWETDRSRPAFEDVRHIAEVMEFDLSSVSYAFGLTGPEAPRSPYEVLAQLEREGKQLPRAKWSTPQGMEPRNKGTRLGGSRTVRGVRIPPSSGVDGTLEAPYLATLEHVSYQSSRYSHALVQPRA